MHAMIVEYVIDSNLLIMSQKCICLPQQSLLRMFSDYNTLLSRISYNQVNLVFPDVSLYAHYNRISMQFLMVAINMYNYVIM